MWEGISAWHKPRIVLRFVSEYKTNKMQKELQMSGDCIIEIVFDKINPWFSSSISMLMFASLWVVTQWNIVYKTNMDQAKMHSQQII